MLSVLRTISTPHPQKGEGVWYKLLLPADNGSQVPTDHQLLVDVHFELPPGKVSTASVKVPANSM